MHQRKKLTSLGHVPKLQSFSGKGNVTSIMEKSWQGTEIRTGLQDLRNLFSYCINIYRAPHVDKAVGDTEMSLACPFPQGVSSNSINNKKVEGVKCHKDVKMCRWSAREPGALAAWRRRSIRFWCAVINTFLWLFLRMETENVTPDENVFWATLKINNILVKVYVNAVSEKMFIVPLSINTKKKKETWHRGFIW